MRILIITKDEEMKQSVAKYLKENIWTEACQYIVNKPYFKIATKAGNEYRVWLDPNECTMCGVTVDLIYLDDRMPLSCLESFMPLVDFNILNIKLINKPENIRVKMEDRKW
jgi:hypothetical protein